DDVLGRAQLLALSHPGSVLVRLELRTSAVAIFLHLFVDVLLQRILIFVYRPLLPFDEQTVVHSLGPDFVARHPAERFIARVPVIGLFLKFDPNQLEPVIVRRFGDLAFLGQPLVQFLVRIINFLIEFGDGRISHFPRRRCRTFADSAFGWWPRWFSPVAIDNIWAESHGGGCKFLLFRFVLCRRQRSPDCLCLRHSCGTFFAFTLGCGTLRSLTLLRCSPLCSFTLAMLALV